MAGKSHTDRTTIAVAAEKAVLAAVRLPDDNIDERDPMGELRSLAETAGARVVSEMTQNRQRPEAGTFIGSGKVDELKTLCEATGATLIIFDNNLSPSQIGNIEKRVERKVIDRSELILDIFASRATTHEAKLQVELAQLEYTYPRLRAMWDHLERIVGVGGVGGIGTRGPGEQQLEIDRRLVRKRLSELRGELEVIQARKRREVEKRNTDFFTVGLVGYTNAGKSTLFNTLTEGGAYVADKLFATLTTRTREWSVESETGSTRVMISDTVGFVRNLPHNLVASFKATLEEATHADLLLLVLDVSDPSAERQYETVNKVLDELFADVAKAEARAEREWAPPRRLLLLNKIDRLEDNANLLVWQARVPDSVPIVARDPDGAGQDLLRAAVLDALRGPMLECVIRIPLRDSKGVHAIEQRAQVLDRAYEDGAALLRVRIGANEVQRLRALGATIEDAGAPAS